MNKTENKNALGGRKETESTTKGDESIVQKLMKLEESEEKLCRGNILSLVVGQYPAMIRGGSTQRGVTVAMYQRNEVVKA